MRYQIINGDCIEAMRAMPDNSVDSVVTDPPYELTSARPGGRSPATQGKVMKGFMGMAWDGSGIAYSVEMWAEALRVLKPGGHLLAFSGSRTYHRMTCAIEDAGFEVRDQIMWLYGSGFPKSHNLAGEHAGWGTALKPSHEPIAVARKPFKGTVAANVLAFGTGAINIGACRVNPTAESRERAGEASQDRRYTEAGSTNFAAKPGVRGGAPEGRWPANIIHDGSDEVVALFPDSKGQMGRAKDDGEVSGNSVYGKLRNVTTNPEPRGDIGSAARFFYCAKASKKDRGTNNHPTVKPTDLMAYLVRLVTPPGGLVLDPFMGSGSTGKACMREGFRFIGCELSAEYAAIADARIQHEIDKMAPEVSPSTPIPQLDLFGMDAA